MVTASNLFENGGSEIVAFTSPEQGSEEVAARTAPSELRSNADNSSSSAASTSACGDCDCARRQLPSGTVLQ